MVHVNKMPIPGSTPGGRKFRGLSPEERQRQRHARLIAAGVELFGSRGFHAVGVRDICAEARLTERYFYESFSNREVLFLAVYDHAVDRIRQAIMTSLQSAPSDAHAMARAALQVFLETLQGEPRLSRILLIDVMAVGTDASNRSIVATQGFTELVGTLTHALHPDLARHKLNAHLIANGLVGSTTLIVMHWVFRGFQEPLEDILEHCLLFYDALNAKALHINTVTT